MNTIGEFTRITPEGIERCFSGVRMHQGSQILRVPEGSSIRKLTLGGGASSNSRWAALRGGVLKFGENRGNSPIEFTGENFFIPSAHTLMDLDSLGVTMQRNPSTLIAPKEITDIASERLFLLHSSYCHPDQIFLAQGAYTMTEFDQRTVFYSSHMNILEGVLSLDEEQMNFCPPLDILQILGHDPAQILVKLMEGGFVSVFRYTQEQMREMKKL